jgi:hypothetical protein
VLCTANALEPAERRSEDGNADGQWATSAFIGSLGQDEEVREWPREEKQGERKEREDEEQMKQRKEKKRVTEEERDKELEQEKEYKN